MRRNTNGIVRLGQLALGFLMLLSLTRCGSQQSTTPASGTFSSVYSIMQTQNCMSCHETGKTASSSPYNIQLDFSTQALAYSTLTTKTVTDSNYTANCSSVSIVKASNAQQSYLAAVLFSDYSSSNFAGATNCTPLATHQTQFTFSSSDKTSIINWIQNGALNN